MPLLCRELILMGYFIFFLTTQTYSLALHAEKTRLLSPRFISPAKAATFPSRLIFSTAWTCPKPFPQALFLPRDFHLFLFLLLWPLLRDEPSLGSDGQQWEQQQWEGWGLELPQGSQNLPELHTTARNLFLGPSFLHLKEFLFHVFIFSGSVFWGWVREDDSMFQE